MKSQRLPALLALHLAVFLFGSAGVVGKATALSALVLVFGRCLFAFLSLLPVLALRGQLSLRGVPWSVAWCGILLAIHWLTFFAAINTASVAFGLMGFASFPLFVAWLEPWLFKEPRHQRDWFAAVAVVLGMWLMVSDAGWGSGAGLGLLLGIASGFSFALLAMANRWQGNQIPPFKLAWLQNGVACLSLLPFIHWPLQLSTTNWVQLLVLGTVFTALSHGMFMFSLRSVSARLASLTAALEPVYGIALAFLWLHEVPGPRVIAGCVVILSATTIVTIWQAPAAVASSIKEGGGA